MNRIFKILRQGSFKKKKKIALRNKDTMELILFCSHSSFTAIAFWFYLHAYHGFVNDTATSREK